MARKEELEKVLNERVRHVLREHGGDLRVVELTGGNVLRVELTGACGLCPAAHLTLENVVKETVQAALPWVKGVEAVFGVSEELLKEARRFLSSRRDE
ncbi:NifU family protein [Thermanaerosceptrum fracticalcis]|jgi:Fe-S cluster biogenesis protein NfuA|uniref:NifU family protein n=1 Tax=Thermanaerosceptrum fracticalcis TaxID=1712410 RepID=A0A7G6E3T9_THEFR|nr:NifU family protein [Thermanaerosceptrum fracticalcis]QNB46743.1 NifU family protein [Thermanaerosceptrum fracticalcis]